ncbi:adenosylhomocysteinase [Embleya sp. NPDC059237]|uniref:adenosylhomocysteinase n=1 Tax=Embleya sp. NPDC059237 TaxID=3346784 RepID=UPI0036AC3310
MSTLAAILPKPKSVDQRVLAVLGQEVSCDPLTRGATADPERLLPYLETKAAGRPLVLLDVGGYFAPTLAAVCARFSGRVLGVVEDTENGLRRYLRSVVPCPVFSVARSPLKDVEDGLVGESVVFSCEALLRTQGLVLPGRRAMVFGFGKIGSSIARSLHARCVHVTVVDNDPIRQTQAIGLGHHVARDPYEALPTADLVFCATGNQALTAPLFARLKVGAYVVSATSGDDELDLAAMDMQFTARTIAPHITRHTGSGHHFHLLNDGNAVNFLHGSAVGPSIHLVQAEILTALAELAGGGHGPGIREVSTERRAMIATAWMDAFYPVSTP